MTLGLCLIGAVPFLRGGLVFIAQMLGAMAAAGIVKGLFPGPLAVSTSLSGGTSKTQGLFIEMVSQNESSRKYFTDTHTVSHGSACLHDLHACCKHLIADLLHHLLTVAG